LEKATGRKLSSHLNWRLLLNTVLVSLCLDKVVLDFKQVKYKTMITELSRRSTGTLRSLSYESLKGIWVQATSHMWILFQVEIYNANCHP
jgi:hypothetical protein